MSTPKHTPGPWTAGDIIRAPSKTKYASDGRGICKLYSETRKQLVNEQQANARLIAAAPELLEELRRALEFLRGDAARLMRDGAFEPHNILRRQIRSVEAAIAKATGGAE